MKRFICLIAFLNAVSFCIAQQTTSAQPQLGAGFGRIQFDQAVVNRGRELFGPSCGFCHGQDARGTGAGPDLGRSLLILSDENGQQLGQFLQTGRPDRGMPAFPTLTAQQISDIATFLHSQVQAARSRTSSSPPSILVGDAKAGEVYFTGAGKCSTCHSISGDLKGIGSKYDPVTLQDQIVSPRSATRSRSATFVDPYPRRVRVLLPQGAVSGTLIYLSEFAVTLVATSGERQTYERDGATPKVEVIDPLQAHQDLLMKYTDAEIHDLTAYLSSQK